jgi:hypothetical protein
VPDIARSIVTAGAVYVDPLVEELVLPLVEELVLLKPPALEDVLDDVLRKPPELLEEELVLLLLPLLELELPLRDPLELPLNEPPPPGRASPSDDESRATRSTKLAAISPRSFLALTRPPRRRAAR